MHWSDTWPVSMRIWKPSIATYALERSKVICRSICEHTKMSKHSDVRCAVHFSRKSHNWSFTREFIRANDHIDVRWVWHNFFGFHNLTWFTSGFYAGLLARICPFKCTKIAHTKAHRREAIQVHDVQRGSYGILAIAASEDTHACHSWHGQDI